MGGNSFKEKAAGVKTIGNREINSDEALNLVIGKIEDEKHILVKISSLSENPYQPRKHMNPELLADLAESMGSSGLVQPIVITPIDGNPNRFYIVAGHRRVAASKINKSAEIKAIVINITDQDLRMLAILENLQRENLSTLDEAESIKGLVDCGIKQLDICKKLGKSKSFISQMVSIGSLDEDSKRTLRESGIEFGISILHELTQVEDNLRQTMVDAISKNGLNRAELRDFVKKAKNGESSPKKPQEGHMQAFRYKQKKDGKIDIKIDLNSIKNGDDKSAAIEMLEKLLEELRNV